MIPTIKQQLQPMSFDDEGTELPSLRLQSGNTYYDEDEDDGDSDGCDDIEKFANKYYWLIVMMITMMMSIMMMIVGCWWL